MAKEISLPMLYTIPVNWRWIEMGKVVICKSGFPFDSSRFSSEKNGKKPLIRIRDVVRGKTETYTDENCPEEYIINCDDILIGMDGDFNVAKWQSEKALLNQRVCNIYSSSDLLNNDYLFYYLPDPLKKINDATPSVTVKHLSTKTLCKASIPMPPLSEQKRIVSHIESLFSKLDEAKEKAQAVVDGYEDRKAAILHKAFTGELTEKWREENNESYDDWIIAPIEKVCTSIYDGDHMPPPKADRGVPFLVISNINKGHLNFDDTRYVPQEYYDGLSDTRKPEFGDVLYTLVGSYGIPVVVDDSRPFCFQRHMALLKPSSIDTYFLWYQLQEHEFYNKATEIATGTAQLTVPIKGLRKLTVKVPQIEEQHKIVSLIDNMISKEEKVKEAAIGIITQIDEMKKSILAKAFRGELGTNDPSEEPVAL